MNYQNHQAYAIPSDVTEMVATLNILRQNTD